MKPELLLPAGNIESLYAAIEGGADAVYLGLNRFNARGRAHNFSIHQIKAITDLAKKNKIKVYLTLNILIKNEEIPKLIDTLYFISQTEIDAVIIQDWGIYYLIKNYFPNIKIHGSTQMGINNSINAKYLEQMKFDCAILSREITMPELKKIKKKTNINLEIFIHGALCYSFSGYCFFSSFLGGMSANRGLCKQPCRRLYTSGSITNQTFSLKDLELIDHIPELIRMGISSFKIEGRMKSAEYVYQTSIAYRKAIDEPKNISMSKELLKSDFAREKTDYFFGNNVSKSLTTHPYTGIHIGNIDKTTKKGFCFLTSYPLNIKDRIRILPKSGNDSTPFKITEMNYENKNISHIEKNKYITISTNIKNLKKDDKIFLIGTNKHKFKNKLNEISNPYKSSTPYQIKNEILKKINFKNKITKPKIIIRIDSLKWLPKIFLQNIDQLILNLDKKETSLFNPDKPFIKKNIAKIIIELPLFIPEKDINYYKEKCTQYFNKGIKNFMLNKLAQKNIIPKNKNIKLWTSENVYTLNDLSIIQLKKENISEHIYSIENDFSNLFKSKDRTGIIPVYFYPKLFYSRMPVNLEKEWLTDKSGSYKKIVRNGMTIIVPEKPVSITQHYNKLQKNGFYKFLIDLSFEKPSQNTFNRLIKKLKHSEAELPATIFNYKYGLS